MHQLYIQLRKLNEISRRDWLTTILPRGKWQEFIIRKPLEIHKWKNSSWRVRLAGMSLQTDFWGNTWSNSTKTIFCCHQPAPGLPSFIFLGDSSTSTLTSWNHQLLSSWNHQLSHLYLPQEREQGQNWLCQFLPNFPLSVNIRLETSALAET